ncbi:MAG: hypothetical protein J6D07_05700 [Mogibacterium sp.]|nr:hypothetical protein [Mogibacterium sp.]
MAKYEGTRKLLQGASTGIAVAVAFLNAALIIVKIIQTVTDEADELALKSEENN